MKGINKLIKRKLKEQLDYSGSERMDPRLEKKLADPESMFAKNPAFKRGAADVQKLYSDSFNELVEKVRNVVGKDDLTPNELASIISNTMFRNVKAIQDIEQSNSDELVELAIEGTLNEMEISDDTFNIKATLGMPGNDVVGKMKKACEKIEDELTFEEQEVLDDEVFKRDIINALIGGTGKKVQYIYEKPEIKARLDEINPRLFQLYKSTLPLIDLHFYYLNEDYMDMASGGGGVAGAVEVDDEEDEETNELKTVINAAGFIFPVLCHEIGKGVQEALARQGYPSDTDTANMTLGQADTLKAETEGLRIGPAILKKIRNILPMDVLDKSDIGLINFFFVELYKIPAKEFLNLMKYVISTNSSDNSYAQNEFKDLVAAAREGKQRYLDYLMSQFDDGGLGDQDDDDDDDTNTPDNTYSGGKQVTNFDPNDYVDVSLPELLKNLRDANMLN
jgi:hypothetical protein